MCLVEYSPTDCVGPHRHGTALKSVAVAQRQAEPAPWSANSGGVRSSDLERSRHHPGGVKGPIASEMPTHQACPQIASGRLRSPQPRPADRPWSECRQYWTNGRSPAREQQETPIAPSTATPRWSDGGSGNLHPTPSYRKLHSATRTLYTPNLDPRLRGMHQLVGRGGLLGSENLEGWTIGSLSGAGCRLHDYVICGGIVWTLRCPPPRPYSDTPTEPAPAPTRV